MNQRQFNTFCAALPATTHVVQWGNSDVWKAGGKVFVIASFDGAEPAFTFKVTPLAFEILKSQPGLRGAPYMASRGLLWIQHFKKPGLPDTELKAYIRTSYDMIVAGLSAKRRRELGLT